MNKLHENTAAHRRPKKTAAILIVAVLVVSLLTGAAFAIYYFTLRDLILPEADVATPSQDAGSQEYESRSISLQGYTDSNEYKATVEWLDFKENYDKDGAMLSEIGNSDTGLGVAYEIYGAYTQEMADKLDEIAGKFGLSLHGDIINAPVEDDVEKFMALVASGDFIGDTNTAVPGVVYKDGTFQFEGYIADYETVYSNAVDFDGSLIQYDPSLTTPEDILSPMSPDYFDTGVQVILVPYGGSDKDAVVPDFSSGELSFVPYDGDIPIDDIRNSSNDNSPIRFQFRYCKKGSIDYTVLGIGSIEEHTTWAYETACGNTVTLSQSPYQSLLITELSDAFVTINIMDGSKNFSAYELEAFADTIDFTLLK